MKTGGGEEGRMKRSKARTMETSGPKDQGEHEEAGRIKN
jgi:hypothetical protein